MIKTNEISDLIYGKDKREQITSISVVDGLVKIYFANNTMKVDRHKYFCLWDMQHSDNHHELSGNMEYKYFTKRSTEREFRGDIAWARRNRVPISVVYNPVEQYMLKTGTTYYKGMQLENLNVLSFDLETTGLRHDDDSKILIISNTYKSSQGVITRKSFYYDDYSSQTNLIEAWCDFVNKIDPHILLGHNIIGYDLPYLEFCYGKKLPIGKNRKPAAREAYTRKFRKDGSQTYDYNNYLVEGREVIDTWFLAIKYDVGRRYPSYRLKDIIAFEGLEVQGRQHYDASTIPQNYTIASEWEKIKRYAEHDADDSYNLFYLMAPSYFYYTQSISKPFQEIILGATGSQINNIMTRAYLQNGHSIPKASTVDSYEGGISFGNPGIYEHVCKVDVASMYPSIILDKGLYNEDKDPNAYLLKMTEYFTKERLSNKKRYKDTGKRHYNDLQNAQKIVINSIYGFLGCGGLNFNSPDIAAFITYQAREHLSKGIEWAEEKGFKIVNADTDSFVFQPFKRVTNTQFTLLIDELNRLFSDAIVWENDGRYRSMVIVKAKNYAMQTYTGKISIKGSGLKGTMKEPALQEYLKGTLKSLLKNDLDSLISLYNGYAKEILYLDSMERWSSKKTITQAVLKPSRTNESRVLDACRHLVDAKKLGEGDKIHVFFRTPTELTLKEEFDGTYDVDTLLNKLYATAKIFAKVVDIKKFLNYKLKKNKPALEVLANEDLLRNISNVS